MPPESLAHRSERARAICDELGRTWPEATIALHYETPLQLLVAVVLSAQCTDERVNRVTPELFARYPDAAALAAAEQGALEGQIRSCGLFRAKAHALIRTAQALVADHGGEVPRTREQLAALPGVGNKSAGVIALHLSGEPAFPVDTHVARLAYRLDLSRASAPDAIERDLRALLPPALWGPMHHRLIWHGRRVCLARSPQCERCSVNALCPKRGVKQKGRAPAHPERRPRRRPKSKGHPERRPPLDGLRTGRSRGARASSASAEKY